MNQKELQEHYKRVFDTESGKQVLLDLERVTNTTRVTADSPNPYSAIFVVAQQQLLKRIRNMTQLRTAKIEKDPKEIKKLLISQIYSTVKWRESMVNMFKNGVENFIEIGPGKVLTGMVKRTIPSAKTFSINSIADIKNLKDAIK